MNYNLSESDVQEVKQAFGAWEEIEDRLKELRLEKTEVLKRAAVLYECKPGKISKLFKFLKKKSEVGEDEVEEMSLMEETIKNPSE